MKKLKEWAMNYIVKKFLGQWIGQAIAKADGKRTWIGVAIMAVLALAKFVLPLFVPIGPEILEAIDSLMLIVAGSTGSFATVKTQKLWEGMKKAGDEVIKP